MKKAQIFDISMVLVVIGAMVGILVVVHLIANETSPLKGIGRGAFDLQRVYGDADLFTSFMATSARWAYASAIQQLGGSGGHLQSPCGNAKGVQLWNKEDSPRTFCFPLAYENLYLLLGEKMDQYSSGYAGIRKIPYEFLVNGNRLLGIATVPIYLKIMQPKEQIVYYYPGDVFGLWTERYTLVSGQIGVYVFRPDFEIPFTYNLDIYKAIARAAQEAVNACADLGDNGEKKNCAKDKITAELQAIKEDADMEITDEGDVFFITLTQAKRKSVYHENQAPTIKFALALPSTD